MKCPACAVEAAPCLITKVIRLDNCEITIKNIPAYTCKQCGEQLLTYEVMVKLDEILKPFEAITCKCEVLADYAA